eukprot:COSAG04_NODE_785_length_10316_cov_29.681120_8_plen_247_part_00
MVGASGHRHRDARAGRGGTRGVGGGGRSRGAGLVAPSMLWRCGWPAARARRQLRTVEPVKAPLQRRSRLAPGQEGGMRTPRAGPMGCCCRYTPALSTRATNVASSGGSSGSECTAQGGGGWEGKVGRAAALRRSGWRRAHDAFGGGAYAGPRQQLGSRHAIPGRHARRERRLLPPCLAFSAATSIAACKQEIFPRIHLWETARWWDSPAPALVHLEGFTAGSGQPGLNRGRGRPGSPLQAAGRPRT